MIDIEYAEILRKELSGMVTLLENLRTNGDARYLCVQSRKGSMVLVADAINSANKALAIKQEHV